MPHVPAPGPRCQKGVEVYRSHLERGETETTRVRSVTASRTTFSSTRPYPSTGSVVTENPYRVRKLAAFVTAGRSTAEMTMRFLVPSCANARLLRTRLFDSPPQLVKTLSSGSARISVASCSCFVDGGAQTKTVRMCASITTLSIRDRERSLLWRRNKRKRQSR